MKINRLFLLALAIPLAVPGDLAACGDKFLVVSRGTRYQKAPIARPPASILVYANPSSALPRALSGVAVEKTLREAGYRPRSVVTAAELEAALGERQWDLVLTDLAEGSRIRAMLAGGQQAVVLPVAYETSATALAEAMKEYRLLLTAPVRPETFLEAVDDAVDLKQKIDRKRRR